MNKTGLPPGEILHIGKKIPDPIDEVICMRQSNGKYGCKLFLDPMFKRGGPKDETLITMVTPEGTARVMPTEVWMGNAGRRDILVKDISKVNAWRIPSVSVDKKSKIEINPTKFKIMHCGISQLGPGTSVPGKHLNCVCVDIAKIERGIKK